MALSGAVVIELGGIWWELSIISRDQLKSAYTALPEARLDKMPDAQKRAYRSTLRRIAEDVEVSVTNEPPQVEVSQ